MKSKLQQYYQNSAIRHHQRVVAFALFGLVVLTLVTIGVLQRWDIWFASDINKQGTTTAEVVVESPNDPSRPLYIRIPEVGIEAPFEAPLGLNADQTIEVPDSYETVGWYKYGPTPGELGPAVVLGHVDSYKGPAVFWALGQLEEGDLIEIDREDGTTVTFAVERLNRYPQSNFPTAEVYGDLDYAGLRLITCTGVYDHGTLEYSHNLVVFARLVEDEPTEG